MQEIYQVILYGRCKAPVVKSLGCVQPAIGLLGTYHQLHHQNRLLLSAFRCEKMAGYDSNTNIFDHYQGTGSTLSPCRPFHTQHCHCNLQKARPYLSLAIPVGPMELHLWSLLISLFCTHFPAITRYSGTKKAYFIAFQPDPLRKCVEMTNGPQTVWRCPPWLVPNHPELFCHVLWHQEARKKKVSFVQASNQTKMVAHTASMFALDSCIWCDLRLQVQGNWSPRNFSKGSIRAKSCLKSNPWSPVASDPPSEVTLDSPRKTCCKWQYTHKFNHH